MNPDRNTQPVLDNMLVDGGDPTEQEQALIDQGLDDAPAAPDEALVAVAPAAEAATVVPDPDAEAAAAAAAAAQAREEAEQSRALEQANAATQADADVIARATPGEKPVAPEDFDAAFAALEKKEADGDLNDGEYARELRRLTRAEAAYTVAVSTWESQQAYNAQAAAEASQRAENAWNAAALQWEADNGDFMANPLRAQRMQEAINLVIGNNARDGKAVAPAAVLAEAARVAFDFVGYQAPSAAAEKDPKIEIAAAVAARKPERPAQTLGDVPNAGNEPVRSDEAFAGLDRMGIEDLEDAMQHMTPAQQEKYLRDAPGATAGGRGVAE